MYIISLTSHGNRLQYVGKMLFANKLLLNKNLKVVITLYKDDVNNIPNDLKTLIENNIIELIIAEKDLGPHLKYFYAMKKYRDLPIITIDDDRLYNNDINLLIEEYKKHPNSIIGNCCIEIQYSNDTVLPLIYWQRNRKKNITSKKIMAEGFAGILYPPNCLNVSDEMIDLILSAKYDDDIFLKMHEIKNNIMVYATNSNVVGGVNSELSYAKNESLSAHQNKNNINRDNIINKFKNIFLIAK